MRTTGKVTWLVLAATLLLPATAAAGVRVTLLPSVLTVASGQTQDFTVQIQGTQQKGVRLHVCDGNGENCVRDGSGLLGTVAVVARDENNNPIVRYTAPATLPPTPPCTALPNGCQLQLRVKLTNFPRKRAFAAVALPDASGPANAGVLERVSVRSDGTEANNGSDGGWVSADGRFVAFSSGADNLVDGDTNGQPDVFLRDTCVGAANCTPATTRVSLANDGGQFFDPDRTYGNAISGDGRFVVFTFHHPANICPDCYLGMNFHDDIGSSNAFLRDTCQGAASCTPATTQVSVDSDGFSLNGTAYGGPISADGRFVALQDWSARTLLRDTCQGAGGCTPATALVSLASDGSPANSSTWATALSADGRFVALSSWASNLVEGDTNSALDIFLRDTCQGAVDCTPATLRASVGSDGSEPQGGVNGGAAMSANGRYVVFGSPASTLVAGDTNGLSDVFLRDTCQGAVDCTPTTVRVSVSLAGTQANGSSYGLAISAEGRYVAFVSAATNVVAGDTNGVTDLFVRDTCLGAPAGCVPTTVRVSVAGDGTQANGASGVYGFLTLTADGRFVAFTSPATNLVPGDTNGSSDVFLARTGY